MMKNTTNFEKDFGYLSREEDTFGPMPMINHAWIKEGFRD